MEQKIIPPYLNLDITDIDGEVWKEVTEFPFYYLVSSKGRLKSKAKNIILTQQLKEGYLVIKLSVMGERYTRFVHRLVAQSFILNPLNKPEVNHLKEKTNCCIETLEWVTPEENRQHAYDTGRSKLLPIIAFNEDETIEFISLSEAARHFNVIPSEIWMRLNKSNPFKGYFFKADTEVDKPDLIDQSKKVFARNNINTIVFDSISQAARHFNREKKSFRNRIGKNKLYDGYVFSYN